MFGRGAQWLLTLLGNGFGSKAERTGPTRGAQRLAVLSTNLFRIANRPEGLRGYCCKLALPSFALREEDSDLLRAVQLLLVARQLDKPNNKPERITLH